MRAVSLVLEHPFALFGLIVAILYAWSTLGRRREIPQSWSARRIIRTLAPTAAVIILVLAASAELQLHLPRVDFGMFYSSALLLRHDPDHLYNAQKQTEFLHAVTGLQGEAHYLPFAYPPFVAFLFTPLTALSFKAAYYAMLAINFAVLVFIFYWLASRLKFNQDHRMALLLLGSAALPLYAVLILGHLSFLGVLFLSLFVIDVMANRATRAGLWTGLMLFKPILFPVPLLMLLMKREWKAIALFIGTAIALLGSSYALIGWNGLLSNVEMMRLMTSDYLLPRTHSLRGLVFYMGLGPAAWIVAALTVAVTLGYAAVRAPNQRWVMAGAILAVMLVPPYLQYHDLAIGLIAIAVSLAAMRAIQDKTRSFLFLAILVSSALALMGPDRQPVFPIMSVVLTIAFGFCMCRSFQPNRPDDCSNYRMPNP